ncbi:efflux RND transporter periplasmic adaptor subunit [Acidobacteriota bacterium]
MKKGKYLVLLGIGLILASCAPGGEEAQLAKMEKQRDVLIDKIEVLKAQIALKVPLDQKPEKITDVRISLLEKELFQHFIQVQGTIESDNNILVAPMASGIVKKIHTATGKSVTKGQLLAELDGSILESSILEVENGLNLAQIIFERQQRLWDKKIGSEIEYLQAKTNKDGLEKRLDTLKEQLKLTKIFSPISGTVDEVIIKEGEMGAAGMGAFRVVELSNLKVKIDLSEIYISRINKNDKVHVSIPVIGKEFDLFINTISQIINSDDRTFQIEVNLPKNEQGIKPNMLAVLIINDYSNPEALTVPINIVQETGTEKFLFVASENDGEWTTQKRIVTTGKDFEGRIEILSGLQENENFVTVGYQNLSDGQKLAVTKEQE